MFIVAVVVAMFSTTVLCNSIPTATSACVTQYMAPSFPLKLIPLAELVECFRTTPMDAATAYNLVEYAQYAYELHSLRGHAPHAEDIRRRIEGLFTLFDSTTTSAVTASFHADAHQLSEFDFHVILVNALNAMQDYHFGLIAYHLFGSSFLSRPFVFGCRWNTTSSSQELYIRAPSLSLDYWSYYFNGQSSVLANPLDGAAFDFNAMANAIRRAASKQLSIRSIAGLEPIQQYMLQLWRVSSNMADDHSVFNDLLDMNLNPLMMEMPPQYFLSSTSRKWTTTGTSGPSIAFLRSQLYVRNTSLPTLNAISGSYYEDFVLSDDSIIRVPLLVDLRNTASAPSCAAESAALSSNSKLPDTSLGSTVAQVNGSKLSLDHNALLTLATRQKRLRGEALYRVSPSHNPYADIVDDRETPSRRGRRRRLDPYVAYSDVTANALAHRVYASGVIDGFYVGPNLNNNASVSTKEASLMILRIRSFAGQSFAATINDFVGCLNAVLSAAEGDRASNLLIDVRGNGGGYVQAQMILLSILDYDVFQKNYTTKTYVGVSRYPWVNVSATAPVNSTFRNETAMVYSANLSSKIAFNTSSATTAHETLSPGRYYDAVGLGFYLRTFNATYNRTDFLHNLTYEGDSIDSTWFYNALGASGTDYNVPDFTAPYPVGRALTWPASWSGWTNVTLVTDGACGSACSMFETRLSEHLPRSRYNVTSVGFGGLHGGGSSTGAVMQSSQFTGGSVLSMACNAALFKTGGYSFPGRISTSANSGSYYPVTMRFNVWHWLSDPDDPDVPRQYVDHPVEHQIRLWDVTIEDVVNVVYGGNVAMRASAATGAGVGITALMSAMICVQVVALLC